MKKKKSPKMHYWITCDVKRGVLRWLEAGEKCRHIALALEIALAGFGTTGEVRAWEDVPGLVGLCAAPICGILAQ